MTEAYLSGQAAPEASRAEAVPNAFYISGTTSILERRPRTLKHGDTFAVFDHYGDVSSRSGSPEGVFNKDTRFLSELRVFVNGRRPLLLSSTVQDNNALLTSDLTNPDLFAGGELKLARDTILIVRSKFLWDGACYERLGVRNFGSEAHVFEFVFHFSADFADIFELRGHRRERRGKIETRIGESGVVFLYHGLDGVVRRSTIRFDPAPAEIGEDNARFFIELAPRGRSSLFMTISCEENEPEQRPTCQFFTGMRNARHALLASTARAASIETSNDLFNEVLCRSMADLYMLMTDTPQGAIPYAGIPWYSTPFGRDAIITAIEMLWIDSGVAKGVLRFLAATQAREIRRDADAEPGKILHEMRSGEMARLGEVPFARYYGSVDSTPLFVILAGLYFERTRDLATISELWPNIEAALDWIDAYGDRDRDGFVEYQGGETGLTNQGWKDSADSVFHADGSDAEGPIALCEVQGYVYAAKRLAANMAAANGLAKRADALEREAEDLRTRFEEAFWRPDIGTYALALDGRKRPCEVRSSNAGQLLFTGIVAQKRAAAVAEQLLDATFFTGWGIRTIASSEARYNPMSYHNGSVWPHDNALIGLGFARYGMREQTQRLLVGLYDTSRYMDLRRPPELFCGLRRTPGKGPTLYPVACSPQAWSSAAPLALLQGCLGLEFDFQAEQVCFRRPTLPDFLDRVVIRSLTVGGSQVDILLRRYASDVSVNVLRRVGNAEVMVKQ
ncbi:MAG TPA: amylo-alpha-1,6-glucosidase [Roseiarcus sp.]|nr:amylo-alpha-1,6-glucosidase [Roseiarcus sp.]